MEPNQGELVRKIWEYPLFKALANRRGHRFGLGMELREAPFPHKSDKAGVPLTELEIAHLCWAGYGVTGLINADLEYSSNTFMNWGGRTVPGPCNDQHNDLLFMDDDGVFLYRPKAGTLPVEVAAGDDEGKILKSFREGKVELIKGRADLPPAAIMKLNQWNFNKPGQITFFPIIDLTWESINAAFVWLVDERWQIIDENRGGKPAGVGKWVDNGYLSGMKVPLAFTEQMMSISVCGIGHYMAANIGLAATSFGLGSFVWGGFVPLVLLGGTPLSQGFGFRFTTDKKGMPQVVGKDGFIETVVPPYVADMDEAVDRVVEYKYGKGGLFSTDCQGEKAFKDPQLVTKVDRPDKEAIDCVKALCRYVFEEYGRFPSSLDPLQMPVAITAHHIDEGFYETYYKPGVIRPEQRDHMKVWHGIE